MSLAQLVDAMQAAMWREFLAVAPLRFPKEATSTHDGVFRPISTMTDWMATRPDILVQVLLRVGDFGGGGGDIFLKKKIFSFHDFVFGENTFVCLLHSGHSKEAKCMHAGKGERGVLNEEGGIG